MKYVLLAKATGEYRSKDGYTKDLQKAALFTNEEASKHSEQFRPNFEFLQVEEIKGKRRLVY